MSISKDGVKAFMEDRPQYGIHFSEVPLRYAAMRVLAFVALLFTSTSGFGYATGFEPPVFTLGDVDGQDGWGHLSNSPTRGEIEPVPAGSPVAFGTQSLALRTRNVDFFGVANHLYSATIDPPAGETGSTVDGVVVAEPQAQFSATLWYRTPSSPVISTRGDGRIAELNPSSKGPEADDPANRYAQVRVFNDAGGGVRVEIGWYTAAGFTAATVAMLDWGAWYRLEYRIALVDGTAGEEPNDRFSLTIYDAAGALAGSACGSTWELGWKSGDFGGGTSARAINGFDFWSVTGPNDTLVGHLDQLAMSATAAGGALAVSIGGNDRVCCGETSTLTANVTGGSGAVTSYTWRNANGDVIGSGTTVEAPAGIYSVTVTDASCGTATSSPFVVADATSVPTASEITLLLLALSLAAVAVWIVR